MAQGSARILYYHWSIMLTDIVLSLMKTAANPGPFLLWSAFLEAIDEPEYPAYQPKIDLAFKEEVTVLTTGGLDSTIAYHLVGKKPQALYIDFGQSYRNAELDALKHIGIDPWILQASNPFENINSDWKHIYPGRNLYALLSAAEYTRPGGVIWFGSTYGEMPKKGGDKSEKFLKIIRQILAKYYGGIQVKTMAKHTKGEWVKLALKKGVKEDILLSTYSCFTGEIGYHCGRCQACLRRFLGLRWGGLPKAAILWNYRLDPSIHAVEALDKYRKIFLQEYNEPGSTKYGHRRAIQDLSVLEPTWVKAE